MNQIAVSAMDIIWDVLVGSVAMHLRFQMLNGYIVATGNEALTNSIITSSSDDLGFNTFEMNVYLLNHYAGYRSNITRIAIKFMFGMMKIIIILIHYHATIVHNSLYIQYQPKKYY